MHQRMQKMATKDWNLFLEQNEDLLADARSVLLQYFSEDVLFSYEARASLIQPDIKPF